jgi:U3 small nucleolar RNA-associated protein 23
MRQKRAKAYRKLMALYSMSFGFRQPYQVLGTLHYQRTSFLIGKCNPPPVDSEMCKTATEHKLELIKQLAIVLQGTVKPSEFF